MFLHYYPTCLFLSFLSWSQLQFVPPSVFFAILGIVIALLIYYMGPSGFLGIFYYGIGYLVLFAGLTVFILMGLFFPPFLFFVPIILIVGIVMVILGKLLMSLGIVRTLGLFLIIFTILFFISTNYIRDLVSNVAGLLNMIPYITEIILEALYRFEILMNTISIGGVVIGALLLIFGGGLEIKQIQTYAMSITTAALSVIQLAPGFILPELGNISTAFSGIPILAILIYIASMFLLRILFAIKWLIFPQKTRKEDKN